MIHDSQGSLKLKKYVSFLHFKVEFNYGTDRDHETKVLQDGTKLFSVSALF